MKFSPFQAKKRETLEEQAWELYKQGLPMRKVGHAVNRSHNWVFRVVKKRMPAVDKQ